MLRKQAVFFCGLVAGLSGCGLLDPYGNDAAPEGHTKISFSSPSRAPGLVLDPAEPASLTGALAGGLMVYVQGVGGTPFATTFRLGEELSPYFFIPNGTYRVTGLGWGAADFAGPIRCGFGENGADIVLNGGTREINITLSTGNCLAAATNPWFYPSTYAIGGQVKPLKVISCTASGMSSVSAAGSPACGSVQVGNIQKIRVVLPVMTVTNDGIVDVPNALPLISGCLNPQTLTALVPLGNSTRSFLPIRIVGFSDPLCTTRVGIYSFPHGLWNTDQVTIFTGSGSLTAKSGADAKLFAGASETELYLRNAE